MMRTKLLAAVVLVLANAAVSDACVQAQPGFGLDADDLIARAEVIVLVRVDSAERELIHGYEGMRITLKVVEVIKGEGRASLSYDFVSLGSYESDDDFAGHSSLEFWHPSNGRSEWFGGECEPRHSFRKGRHYIYFPGKLAAVKSAEVIRRADDRWLRYVRCTVLADKEASLEGAGALPRKCKH